MRAASINTVAIAATALGVLPANARACAVCMGANDSNLAPAMNAAIFTMLGSIGVILLALVAFIICLARRAARPVPGHVREIADAVKAITNTQSHA